MAGDFAAIFRGISGNRSIRKLSFRSCGSFDREIFSSLTPFFKSNRNFECLEIDGCNLGPDGPHLLALALEEFDTLKEFELSQCDDGDGAGQYLQALTRHSLLRKLTLRENRIGRKGCAALASLLKNPKTELSELALADNRLNDESAAISAEGLAQNSTIKCLDLSSNPFITEPGWSAFSDTLSSPSCSLEKLLLRESSINNAAALSLARALSINRSIKVLDLSYCLNIMLPGWMALFKLLQSPGFRLEELNLQGNAFSDETTSSLVCYLASNRSIKSLDISANRDITIAGWRPFSFVLLNPHSVLENLCLSSSGIDDEAMKCIGAALSSNSRLMGLKLCNNTQVTTRGWQAFLRALQNPQSVLEKLDLSGNTINDGTMISLASGLVNNTKLKELQIDDFFSNITGRGWAAISKVLCDRSSVAYTFQSNHTLETLCDLDFEFALPGKVRSLLELNRESSRRDAARLKVLKYYFGSNEVILPFMGMGVDVLPRAIAWMGQDASNNNSGRDHTAGLSLLYRFVLTAPLCFVQKKLDNVQSSKRRKMSQGCYV
eukprot:991002_1